VVRSSKDEVKGIKNKLKFEWFNQVNLNSKSSIDKRSIGGCVETD
jgi:hypothetical protein